MKVYNKVNRTFGLRGADGSIALLIKPGSFTDVPAELEGDITFRTAVKAGELAPFESAKQADGIERATKDSANDEAEGTDESDETPRKPGRPRKGDQ